MHVLIVTQYFWPENFRINDVAIGLKEKGHEVTILTGKPNYPSGRFFLGYGFWSKKESNRSRSQKTLASLDIYGIKSPHGYETPLPPEIWDRTPPEAQEYILELETRVTTLEITVQDLMARLHQDSRTSSRPPSSDPPQSRR